MTDLYKQAGVDIDAGAKAVEQIREAVRATFTPAVLADVGSFGALFALENLPSNPVLVASTDGVGTKVKLAAELGRLRGIGHDIVNHCVNDILVQGATPLFFLDYIASSKLVPDQVAEVVTGIAEACQAAGCALIGGEMAEMPGVYTEGAFDLVGTVVGLVPRAELLPRPTEMRAGDLLLGLASSGPHTNGYSLIRKLVQGRDLNEAVAPEAPPLGEELLAPHRCYLTEIERIRQAGITIKGLAHITGGGFLENIPRILPEGLDAEVELGSWPVPPLFQRLVEWGGMAQAEAYRVFNMGIGMVVVVDAATEPLPGSNLIGRLVEATEPATAPRVQLVEPAR